MELQVVPRAHFPHLKNDDLSPMRLETNVLSVSKTVIQEDKAERLFFCKTLRHMCKSHT